jgi:hypothetical protein
MEALDMPVAESTQEKSWSDAPPVKFEEQQIDLTAFELWRSASIEIQDEESGA